MQQAREGRGEQIAGARPHSLALRSQRQAQLAEHHWQWFANY